MSVVHAVAYGRTMGSAMRAATLHGITSPAIEECHDYEVNDDSRLSYKNFKGSGGNDDFLHTFVTLRGVLSTGDSV